MKTTRLNHNEEMVNMIFVDTSFFGATCFTSFPFTGFVHLLEHMGDPWSDAYPEYRSLIECVYIMWVFNQLFYFHNISFSTFNCHSLLFPRILRAVYMYVTLGYREFYPPNEQRVLYAIYLAFD